MKTFLTEDLYTVLDKVKDTYETPFFLYDLHQFNEEYRKLRQALPMEVILYYSMKANPNPTLCRYVYQWGSPIEVASIGEYKTALDIGLDPKCIVFTGPGKSRQEIRYALEHGVHCINAESFQEMDVIEEEAKELGVVAPLMLRINLHVQQKGSRLRSSGVASQFGVDEDQLEAALEKVRHLDHVNLIGLHTYQGTQNFHLDFYQESIPKMFQLTRWANQKLQTRLSSLGLGGGFGVPYYVDDEPFPMQAFGQFLSQELDSNRDLDLSHIFVESGRYLTSEMGTYVTRVLYAKQSYGKHFAILDGGTHHRAFSTLMGRSFKRPLPLTVIRNKQTIFQEGEMEDRRPVTLVGKLCTPTDVIQSQVWLPELEAGDFILFPNSGAYGLTCGNIHFLSHPLPSEILLGENGELKDISWLGK